MIDRVGDLRYTNRSSLLANILNWSGSRRLTGSNQRVSIVCFECSTHRRRVFELSSWAASACPTSEVSSTNDQWGRSLLRWRIRDAVMTHEPPFSPFGSRSVRSTATHRGVSAPTGAPVSDGTLIWTRVRKLLRQDRGARSVPYTTEMRPWASAGWAFAPDQPILPGIAMQQLVWGDRASLDVSIT
jgi:hypothetical protein